MNNLQAGRSSSAGQNGQQSEMRQQMDKLGEIMRRQQEMMNETFRMDQMQRGQRQRGQNRDEQLGKARARTARAAASAASQGKPMTPEEFADAHEAAAGRARASCASDLEDLRRASKGMGIQPGEGFGEAGEAMGEAGQRARRRPGRRRRSASRAARWTRCAAAPRT